MRLSLPFLAAVSRSPPSKLRKPAVSLDHVSTAEVHPVHRDESIKVADVICTVHPETTCLGLLARDHPCLE